MKALFTAFKMFPAEQSAEIGDIKQMESTMLCRLSDMKVDFQKQSPLLNNAMGTELSVDDWLGKYHLVPSRNPW